jgi:hypothetical protein
MDQIAKSELEKMARDINDIRSFLVDMDRDFHRVKESYISKLRKIKKGKLVTKEKAEKELGIVFG